jgi:hypothetical protein
MKASHCDECYHGIYRGGATLTCEKGHRPKFYRHTLLLSDDFGWRRVCEDFEETKLRNMSREISNAAKD